ncbi:prepilin peptidase [Piscinibacter sp.]|uniref:prepilin peptidase n=1 Tax=Piscinibacter sp. TaxID=1903157 RepID=UPI002CA349A2|nr:A24 family peptidase [Albitalea sp.]HUG24577.1 A24 family peptidase [Albitalea sp.]
MDARTAELLLSPPILALLGLCIGSFLNVVIHRLPQMLERGWKLDSAEMLGVKIAEPPAVTLSTPRSRCPSCGHQIAWHENIPVLSYLRLAGKCSACKTRISPRYPFIEILTGVLFAATAWRFGAEPTTLLWCGFVAVLVALAGIDWDTTLLPDNLTLPLLWAGLVGSALGWTIPLSSSLWGAVAGYLSLWSVYWIFKKATGKEGMGYGDFKLLAALGAWLGVQMILPIVLAASVLGAVVGIVMKMTGALREGRYVPFGPFLAGAGIVVMLAGPARVLGWLGWA